MSAMSSEQLDRIADQVDERFLHWILLLVLIVVVIVARSVIARILNVGHVASTSRLRGERTRGAFSHAETESNLQV
jgi:flagellar basal body-associated protein FliL